uniref:ABC transporter ATP-binding protein n=1 Tax=candidate division WOR-3 bacterium TaxID=2052148 RepID=A0A7C2P5D2_UNCW3
MKPLIELIDIKKTYFLDEVPVEVLRGISLEIHEGEYISIMGPSGSGKSTLMHIIGCLDTPTSGIYNFEGIPVQSLDEDKLAEIRRKKVGFVFQNFNLLPRFTAVENVELPMIYAKVPPKERRDKATRLLKRLGIGHRINHKPTELSGGERQRVAIARALANDPKIILADEPTGNLDSVSASEILNIFDELHKDGRTIVVVTHDYEVAKRAQKIIRIRDGLIVED